MGSEVAVFYDVASTNSHVMPGLEGLVAGFTKRYGVSKLVHAEPFESISYAIQREKTLKKWPRKWKLDLIERDNPQWRRSGGRSVVVMLCAWPLDLRVKPGDDVERVTSRE